MQSGYIIELQEPDKELNVNRYATKKTAAQGKLDTRARNEVIRRYVREDFTITENPQLGRSSG